MTQIYPFNVNKTGVHTKIIGKPKSFNFLSATKQKEVVSLQSSLIFKQINTLQIKQNLICNLQEKVSYLQIEEHLQNPTLQKKISNLEHSIKEKICADLPNAFWERKQHIITLPYEKERGVPRLVINYKPLNKVLQWIRYPIPNKRDLLNRLYDAKVFSKFDMKNLDFDKFRLQKLIVTKQHLWYHLDITNGM